MRHTLRLRTLALATMALTALGGGLAMAGDAGTATWTTAVVPTLPTAGRTIALTQFVGDTGVWAVQDLLVSNGAADTWTMDLAIGVPTLRVAGTTAGDIALSKSYATVTAADALSPVAEITSTTYGVAPTGTLPSVLGVVSAPSLSAAAVTRTDFSAAPVALDGLPVVVATAAYTTAGTTTAIYPGTVTLAYDVDGALAAASLPIAEQTGKVVETDVTFTLID